MARTQTIFTLTLVYVVFALLLNTVGVVILQSAGYFDATKAELSFLEAFKDISIALTAFFIAAQLPKFGYKKSLIFSLILVFIGCITMPLANAFWATKVLLLTVGFGFGIAKVAVYATVGLLTNGQKEHASLITTIEGFFVLGIVGGTLLFGYFIDPSDPKNSSWLNVYWLVAGLCAITLFLVVLMKLDESEAIAETEMGPIEAFKAMIKLIGNMLIIVGVIALFLSVVIEQGINTWLPTFNNEVLHLNPQMAVIAATIFAAAIALGRLFAGFALKRMTWFKYLSLSIIAMAGLIVLTLPLANNITPNPNITWGTAPIATYLFPLLGFFLGPIYPIVSSVVLSTLPKFQHAGATGLLVVFSALGGTFGSFVTGRVFDKFDGQTAFYMTLIPITFILVTLFCLNRITSKAAKA